MSVLHKNVIIIGTGPAGYTAAIYTSRANLSPLVFEGNQPGGQLTITTEIENFPGFKDGIMGPALMDEMRTQAERLGAEIKTGTVTGVDLSSRPFKLKTDSEKYTCDTMIIATGASAKWLGIGKDEELSRDGGGVSACATCDGFFYRGKEVAVVGGGDTALEESVYLTRHASKVTLIHRRNALRGSKIMQDRAMANPKIEFAWNKVISQIMTEKIKLSGSDEPIERIKSLQLKDTTDGSLSEVRVDGLFVAIGHQPNTALFKNQLAMDQNGYLLVEKGSTRTSVSGVFACGDVQDPHYRQAITAAGSGCMAAIDTERWLIENNG
ncbi:MAG: thioredoxin-disulfide reductase [Holophagales bacterium]|jgi:thioredoxin reductase (NADPH)|nr:thioredoxin-disulfide reductase [Holophagales bacterium]